MPIGSITNLTHCFLFVFSATLPFVVKSLSRGDAMKIKYFLLFFCLAMSISTVSWGGNARDYIPLSPESFLFCTYFKHISANTLFVNDNKVGNDISLRENLGTFRPVYYTSIGNALYGEGGFTVDPQALIPFGEAELDTSSVGGKKTSDSGIADPIVLATFWFINSPKDKFWVGFTPYFTLPLGNYDKGKTFNLGNNRWAIKPELGIVKGFGSRTYLEMIINGEFYTDNKHFNTGSSMAKLEQDPVLGVETHLSFDITKQWFVSLDYFYNHGGEQKIDSTTVSSSKVDNHALGVSLFWMIGNNNQLMVEYRDDFAIKNGLGTNTLGARWAYFF